MKHYYFLPLFFLLGLSAWSQTYYFNRTIGSAVSFDKPFTISIDKKGNLYVSNESDWSITKFTAKGEKLFSFGKKGETEGTFSGRVWDMAVDIDQNIYVVDGKSVQMFNARGEFIKRIATSYNYRGIFVDDKRNIYLAVTTPQNQIHKLDPDGQPLLQFGSTGTNNGQFQTAWKVSVSAQGDIYTIDSGLHRIQKFDSLGQFVLTFGVRGAANGQFYNPQALTTDLNGNVWVADTENHRIQQFTSSGKFITTLGSSGSADGQFRFATGVCVDPLGSIYAVDYFNNRVQRFLANGNLIEKYGLRGETEGQLPTLGSISRDNSGNVYVSTQKFVAKYNQKGVLVRKIGSEGNQDGQFVAAGKLATDAHDNLYVCDYSGRIQKFDSTGNFQFVFGQSGEGPGEFKFPQGIDVDRFGNIYVADTDNSRIQKFDPNGKFLLKFGYPDSDTFRPWSIAVDPQGNMYVAENESSIVRKFDSNGRFVKNIATQGTAPGYVSFPIKVTLDPQGNLYIADQGNHRIQIVDREGQFIDQFGSKGNGQGQFEGIFDVEVSPEGDIYVADSKNFTISVFTTALPTLNLIRGKVFIATNTDCVQDSTELGIPNAVVIAQPGPYYAITDSTGAYSMQVETGQYQVRQFLPAFAKNKVVTTVCPQTDSAHVVTFFDKGEIRSDVNFANKVSLLLPYLSCEVSSSRRRRCEKSTTKIVYTNLGQFRAEQGKVYLKLPNYVVLKQASRSYEIDKDSNYVFSIPALEPNESGSIDIIDSTSCVRGIAGLTQCTKAWITPFSQVETVTSWDKSDVILNGICVENGRVQLVIKNAGQSMADSAEFRILLDAQLAFRKNYKLSKGDSLLLKVPANGKTVRLEADQRPDHPRKSQTNLTVEGCVASSSDIVSKGFVNILPQDDAEPEVSISCLPIVDSYDPNDKQVSPQGTADNQYTPTNSKLKYVIRFQNTGTDTAYTVTVVDTLSEQLDLTTMEMGAVSHKYSFRISGKERPILTWKFTNINLPDSTRDQVGSNGFIQFSIKPKPGLSEKTRIENFADIIFDYNDPVRTNTTANVMYDVPRVINPALQLSESIIERVLAAEPDVLKGKLSLYPNPTPDRIWIESTDASIRIEQVNVYNLLGEKQAIAFSPVSGHGIEMNLQAMTRGMYVLFIETNKGTSIRKVIVQGSE